MNEYRTIVMDRDSITETADDKNRTYSYQLDPACCYALIHADRIRFLMTSPELENRKHFIKEVMTMRMQVNEMQDLLITAGFDQPIDILKSLFLPQPQMRCWYQNHIKIEGEQQ